MVDVRHPDALRMLLDRVLGLLLRADEEHRAAPLGEVPRERGCFLQKLERLLEIDDVDPAALAEDEAAHLGIPATRLVPEVHSGLQQLSHGDDCHDLPPVVVLVAAGGGGWNHCYSGTTIHPPAGTGYRTREV